MARQESCASVGVAEDEEGKVVGCKGVSTIVLCAISNMFDCIRYPLGGLWRSGFVKGLKFSQALPLTLGKKG